MQNKQQKRTVFRLIYRNNVVWYKSFCKISTVSVLRVFYIFWIGCFSIDSDLLISFALIHVVGSYSIRTIACIQHQHFTFIVRPSSKVSCLKNRIIGFERIISVKFVNLKLKNIWKNLWISMTCRKSCVIPRLDIWQNFLTFPHKRDTGRN